MKTAPRLAPPDPDVERVARDLSAEGRSTLIGLLGELFNVLDNMETFCGLESPACKAVTTFRRLRQLLTILNRP